MEHSILGIKNQHNLQNPMQTLVAGSLLLFIALVLNFAVYTWYMPSSLFISPYIIFHISVLTCLANRCYSRARMNLVRRHSVLHSQFCHNIFSSKFTSLACIRSHKANTFICTRVFILLRISGQKMVGSPVVQQFPTHFEE